MTTSKAEGSVPGMILGGGVAAVIGAAIWAGIAYGTGYEIGWIAWILGGMVGFGIRLGGGRGPTAGALAAILAVLAICGGKILTVNLTLPGAIEEEFAAELSTESYDAIIRNANDFSALTSEDQHASFMVSHGYTEAMDPGQVSSVEMAMFREQEVPFLQTMKDNPPGYENWKSEQVKTMTTLVKQQFTLWDRLKATLGLMDIIFFALGLATAYQVAASDKEGA